MLVFGLLTKGGRGFCNFLCPVGVAQSSKKGVWRELIPKQPLRWDRGTLQLYVPREAVKRYHVGQGKIRLYSDDKEYATLLIDVVNSRYR